ncbi:hypothetical protein [Sulfuricella sp.]|uniref:hypothetical protein n=1 Tax=Sulfuricella sp. TaxID=2099377 RepID=UPI002C565815|nr:hypothetical protein [Sulfuricella sp.]HUX63845.1 hypothetical protein [Sulfuricella sp.]
MLGPGESVGGGQYQLFVRASDKGLRDIERLLAELDRARKNLRITLQQDVARSGGCSSQCVSGVGRAGDVRIILPGNASSDNSALVIGGGQEDSLRYRITRSAGSTQDNTSQFINVLEGAPAFIRVTYGQDTQFLNVTTGFDVLPHLNGDRVELEIASRLSFVGNQGIQDVRFQDFSTTVSARLGEWVELGRKTPAAMKSAALFWRRLRPSRGSSGW